MISISSKPMMDRQGWEESQLKLETMASTNHALVFLKPHAVSDKAEGFVRGYFGSKSIAIDCCFDIVAEDIDKRQLIDAHYGALAQRAMHIAPGD